MMAVSDPVVIGHRLFDTPVGRCAIAWSALGVLSVQLPEASDERTRARLLRGLRVEPQAGEAAPPPSIARAIGQIVALLGGERADLRDILL